MSLRFHFNDRLRIPEPDFVMFGARLTTGGVRVWVSAAPGQITLEQRVVLDQQHLMEASAEFDGRVDDVRSFDGATYADAMRRAAAYFAERQRLELES